MSGARHTCLSGNGAHHVAPHPVSLRRSCGAAAEGCVTITVFTYQRRAAARCLLQVILHLLSRPLTHLVVGCFTCQETVGEEPNVSKKFSKETLGIELFRIFCPRFEEFSIYRRVPIEYY